MNDEVSSMVTHMRKLMGSDHPVLRTLKRLIFHEGKNNLQVNCNISTVQHLLRKDRNSFGTFRHRNNYILFPCSVFLSENFISILGGGYPCLARFQFFLFMSHSLFLSLFLAFSLSLCLLFFLSLSDPESQLNLIFGNPV